MQCHGILHQKTASLTVQPVDVISGDSQFQTDLKILYLILLFLKSF